MEDTFSGYDDGTATPETTLGVPRPRTPADDLVPPTTPGSPALPAWAGPTPPRATPPVPEPPTASLFTPVPPTPAPTYPTYPSGQIYGKAATPTQPAPFVPGQPAHPPGAPAGPATPPPFPPAGLGHPGAPGQPAYPGAPGQPPYISAPGQPPYPGMPAAGPVSYPYPPVGPPPGMSPEMWRFTHPITFRPKRKNWVLRGVALIAVLALVVAVGAALQSAGSPGTADASQTQPAGGGAATVTPTAAAAPLGPPTVNDVLAAQSHALLSGDLKGFLAPLAHADAATKALYKRMFANLRALRVARWEQNGLEDGTYDATQLKGLVTEDVTIEYCIGDKNCLHPTAVSMELKLRALKPADGGAAVPQIVGAAVPGVLEDPAYANYRDVPPWALTTLYFKQSGRVIVAASSNERSKLSYALPIAVRAAATADMFAHWGRPKFYIVYLANSAEFKKWFSPGDAKDVIGFNYTLSADDNEVTVTLPLAQTEAGPGGLQTVIQHEFGHSATLFGADPVHAGIGKHGEDSFIEGIADLCAFTGHPSWGDYRTSAVRQYIRSGKWSGNAYLTKEMRSTSLLTVNAAYGIGYLAMRHLVEKYGMERALNFWGAVEHDDKSLAAASTAELGLPWTTVNADIKAYIRKAVGA